MYKARVSEPVARLIEYRGDRLGPTHELGLGTFVLGRTAGVDLVLEHADVSRRHAELVITVDGARLRDLGSKNGVRVRGRKVAEAALEDGSRVEIGELVLMFEHPGARVDRLLQRSGEPTIRRPRALDSAVGLTPGREGRAGLLAPTLAALAFALLLALLLVYG